MWRIIFGIRDILQNSKLLLRFSLRNEPIRPVLTFGDGDTGIYNAADDTLIIALKGTKRFTFMQMGL